MKANNAKLTAYYFRNEEHRVCLNANERAELTHAMADMSHYYERYFCRSTDGFP